MRWFIGMTLWGCDAKEFNPSIHPICDSDQCLLWRHVIATRHCGKATAPEPP